MKFIYVLTPAVTRPDCHSQSIIPFVNKIKESDVFDNVIWYVNLDRPKSQTWEFETQEHTIKTFKGLVNSSIQLTINPTTTPCFYSSFSYLFQSLKNDIEQRNLTDDEFCVLWLEDDWKLTRPNDFIRDVNLFLSADELEFYTLYKHKLNIGGNPQLIKGLTYTKYFKSMDISSDQKRDPEVIMRNEIFKPHMFNHMVLNAMGLNRETLYSTSLTFKDKISIANDISKKYGDTFYICNGMYGNVVEDIGDDWRFKRGFKKWRYDQKENGISSTESYTYI